MESRRFGFCPVSQVSDFTRFALLENFSLFTCATGLGRYLERMKTNESKKTVKVSYRTPVGTFTNYDDAHNACMRCDFDPALCIEIVRE